MSQLIRLPPDTALAQLVGIQDLDQRRSMIGLLAASWRHTDINTAWNAVSRSRLNATDKQVMYNELWG